MAASGVPDATGVRAYPRRLLEAWLVLAGALATALAVGVIAPGQPGEFGSLLSPGAGHGTTTAQKWNPAQRDHSAARSAHAATGVAVSAVHSAVAPEFATCPVELRPAAPAVGPAAGAECAGVPSSWGARAPPVVA